MQTTNRISKYLDLERRMLTTADLDELRKDLDASDPQPVDSAKLFYSGVFAGFVYGAFAVLVWKWFR